MTFAAPPPTAAWYHQSARTGFDVVFFEIVEEGFLMRGCRTAVEEGQPWAVEYTITVDSTWTTRLAHIAGRFALGSRETLLQADGAGHWQIDGVAASKTRCCFDVDLESSAMTNALPVHRLNLPVGAQAPAPAAYVRALDLSVERLEQHYVRVTDQHTNQRYNYAAPAFDFECQLTYDDSGFVLT